MGRTSTAIYALARNTEKVCRQKRGKGILINIWPSSRECLTYARPLPMQCPDLSAQPLTGRQTIGMHVPKEHQGRDRDCANAKPVHIPDAPMYQDRFSRDAPN